MSTFSIYSTEHRGYKVLEVLLKAEKPLGPTEIARLINEPWCVTKSPDGVGYAQSSVIVPILRRGSALTHKGKYWIPKVTA
jgi:hypothetical protein